MNVNETYQKHPDFYGEFPTKIVLELARRLPPGSRVLDVGAGQGRNTFALAKHDLQVYALDRSLVGIEQIKQQAEVQGRSNVHAKQGMIETVSLPADTYDAMCFINVLHSLPAAITPAVIEKCQHATKKEGYHAILVQIEAPEALLTRMQSRLWTEEELRTYYASWSIEVCRTIDVESIEVGNDGKKFPIKTLLFLAKKP